ncbi:MAG: hypothetical protein AAGL90_03400 [Pseudomonadota bacterium]
MAFLDLPFKHDLFVSVDHGQDYRLVEWTKHLVSEIQDEILDFESDMNDFNVLFGEHKSANQPLMLSFSNKPGSSGVVLVILSEKFLRSSWCGEEAHWFEEELRKNLAQGGRPIVLLCEPTDPAQWPGYLKQIKDTMVFYSDSERSVQTSGPKPLGFPLPLPDDRAYISAVSKLSTFVVDHLRKIKKKNAFLQERTITPVITRPAEKAKVYLHAKSAHESVWQDVRGALEDSGYDVLPQGLKPIGDNLRDIEMAREERLRILKEEANAACALVVDGTVEHDVQMLVSDRTALRVSGKNIPCALIDQIGSDHALARQLGIETVNAVNKNWPSSFQTWLQSTLSRG